MKAYINAVDGYEPDIFFSSTMARQVAAGMSDPHPYLVAFEVEIPDPPVESDDPADMLIVLADMARDIADDSPADAERIEWALAEIHRLQGWKDEAIEVLSRWDAIADDVPAQLGRRRSDAVAAEIKRLQGIINRRTYYLRMMEMSAQEIAGDIKSALEDPS